MIRLLIVMGLTISLSSYADILGYYYKQGTGVSPSDAFNPAYFKGLRTDTNVDFTFGNPWPDVVDVASQGDVDGFAVRWLGQVNLPSAGSWTFYTRSDDGARLWVDGVLRVDSWIDQGGVDYRSSSALTLTVGWHDIRMEFYENIGGAQAHLYWEGPSIAREIIPAANLAPYTIADPSTATTGIQAEYFNFFDPAAGGTTFPVPAGSVYDNQFTNAASSTAGYCRQSHTVSGGNLDANISFGWGNGSPANIQTEFFGARWRGQVNIPTGGSWTFYTSCDDGSRVWIDGALLTSTGTGIDYWRNQGVPVPPLPGDPRDPVLLGPGWHDIRMDYFENTGGAQAVMNWAGPGVTATLVPQANLRPYFCHGLITRFYSDKIWSDHIKSAGGTALTPGTYQLERIDGPIDSNWNSTSPDTNYVSSEFFSAWYRGKVLIPGTPGTSSTYTFWERADDMVDLFVNGTQILDDAQWAAEHSASITLTAGLKYYIDMRFTEWTGGALCELKYSGPGIGDGSDGARTFIPLSNLFAILNEAPSNIAISANTMGSNSAANYVVGNLSTTDIDNTTGAGGSYSNAIPTQTFTYSLVSGSGSTNNNLFNINGAQLRATNANMTPGTYSVRVRTTDSGAQPNNLYFDKAFTIVVNDTTPPEVTGLSVTGLLTMEITFNEAMGAGVTTVTNYSLSGPGKGTMPTNPDSVVLVSGNTYRLTWTSGEMLDGENVTVTVSSNVKDAAGNSMSTLNNSGTDEGIGEAPTVTNVTSTATNGSYTVGANIMIQVTLSESVTVSNMTPTLTLETGAIDRTASYDSGSGSSTLVFKYTVQAGDTTSDLEYFSAFSLSAGTATIRDAAGNDANLTLASPGAQHSLGYNKDIVIDTTAPHVTNVTSGLADGSYKAGQIVDVQVTFSEVVNVSAGTPHLLLETGSSDYSAGCISGTGSMTLVFRYTVQAGDISADLDYAGPGSLTLDGAVIRDVAGNDAVLTLPAPGSPASLGGNKNIIIDTASPTVTVNQSAGQLDPSNSASILFTAVFNEEVTGFINTDVTVTGTAPGTKTVSLASSDSKTWTLTVSGMTGAGTVIVSLLGGVCTDVAGNGNAASTSTDNQVTYDPVAPWMSDITVAGGGGAITVIFNEPMSSTEAVNRMNYTISGAGIGTFSANPDSVVQDTPTRYTLTWNLPDEMLQGGLITVTAENVRDAAGNLIGTPDFITKPTGACAGISRVS